MLKKITWIMVVLLSWVGYVFLLGGCSSIRSANPNQSSPSPDTCIAADQTNPTITDLPDFVERVSPFPRSVTTLEEYTKSAEAAGGFGGVSAVIRVEPMIEPGDHLDSKTVLERINLCVDTIQGGDIPKAAQIETAKCFNHDSEGNIVASYPCPRSTIFLPVSLNPGKHTATVQIRKTSGDELKFSWTFTIEP